MASLHCLISALSAASEGTGSATSTVMARTASSSCSSSFLHISAWALWLVRNPSLTSMSFWAASALFLRE